MNLNPHRTCPDIWGMRDAREKTQEWIRFQLLEKQIQFKKQDSITCLTSPQG